MADITIIANHLIFGLKIVGTFHVDTSVPLNPLLDTYWNCNGYDTNGDPYRGRLSFDSTLSGECPDNWVDAALAFNFGLSGLGTVGQVNSAETLNMDMTLTYAGVHTVVEKSSWLKWSQVGNLSFDLDHSNIAGERPLYYTGTIYDILRLSKSVIVYGSEGITQVTPIENTWSPKLLIPIGSKNQHAQIGTEDIHWFVDLNGALWEISESKVEKIGYEEYLSSLTGLILSHDRMNNLLYLCNGTAGYMYSYLDRSFCSGPVNISGFDSKGSSIYVVSPAAITLPSISFTTAIYDLGTRKEKTIFNIELGTESSGDMEIRIAYRMDKGASFAYSPWTTITPQGIAYLPCYCREFKLCFRMQTYEKIYLDQIKINGVIHGFSQLDIRRR